MSPAFDNNEAVDGGTVQQSTSYTPDTFVQRMLGAIHVTIGVEAHHPVLMLTNSALLLQGIHATKTFTNTCRIAERLISPLFRGLDFASTFIVVNLHQMKTNLILSPDQKETYGNNLVCMWAMASLLRPSVAD